MQIDRLSLRGFRNYEDAQAQFVPGVNLLVGGNANGKTNLLEAVSYLSTGRSFRTRREAELIRFGADFAELRAQVQSQERTRELRAVLFSGRRPRQLWLAGVRQRSRAALSGVLTSVLFCPEDLMILKKGASGRRRLMDGVICQLRPNYEAALTEYGRLLDQKSALLRERYDNPSLLQVLPEYDLRMAQTGALVISYRSRYAATYYPKVFAQKNTAVLTVAPERTFWEKATILHHEANRPESLEMPQRYSRHYYDLYRMSMTPVKEAAFARVELLKTVADFKMKFYPRSWAKYQEAVPGTLKLVPPKYRFAALAADYEAMKDMLYGDVPMFETVISAIGELEQEIHTAW